MMDKKDAIDYLLYMKHDVLANSPYDVALDTAIEALKAIVNQPKTNGDRIRNMTDEELANRFDDEICLMHMGCHNINCIECALDWLKQEVDPNDEW
jgi:hypothetical protein